MNQKNLERMFITLFFVIYAVIGYFVYQDLIKPAAKAALQFFSYSSSTFQVLPSQPKSHK